ncbi:TPM domain-containing protein [Pseudokineococcus basanitobsidens]|uniref:TPM domain-containing protein n=1 Tax=Pseudokineococcus basanitobsidens TaxID=1926649 RepID=A0ABU8RI59_9ACTN
MSPTQTDALEQQLAAVEASTGADVVALVRTLDATPEETLDQVEALQQAWVATTGADQDTAVAFLVNRSPEDDTDARAGVYVGRTFEEGNVPRGEQEDIVAQALIPPLRDGDVAASLTAGIERLSRSTQDGPPRSAFQDWSAASAAGWLPWTGAALAVAGAVGALLVHRRRERTDAPELPPVTARPGDLPPAVAGALAAGSPRPSAVPAVVLDLAARGALAVEPEKEPGRFSKGTVQLRLLEPGLVRDDVERAVWDALAEQSEAGVVTSSGLQKVARGSGDVRDVVRDELRGHGWWDEGAGRARAVLLAVGLVALVLAGGGLAVMIAGSAPLALVAWVPLAVLGVGAMVLLTTYPRLTGDGQAAARPWTAYREGLDEDARAGESDVDLDAVLPDVVALDLTGVWRDRLDEAAEAGALRALTAPGQAPTQAVVSPWGAFAGAFATSSGGAAGVSGVGAGGGGGAAGST